MKTVDIHIKRPDMSRLCGAHSDRAGILDWQYLTMYAGEAAQFKLYDWERWCPCCVVLVSPPLEATQ